MDRKRYNIIILMGCFVVLLFFISFRAVNRSMEKQITEHMEKIKVDLLSRQVVQTPPDHEKSQERDLSSSDLTPYQIVPQRKSRLFKNQQYWDVLTKEALEKSDTVRRIQDGGIFKGIKKSPEEFKQQILLIDGRIKEYKQRVRGDPNDDYAQQKLQDLYMLKSTVKALRETIVEKR